MLVSACNNSEVKTIKPAYIPSHDSLVLLFTEVQLIEAHLREVQNLKLNLDSVRIRDYGSMFKKFGISKDAFNIIFEYYKDNPNALEAIYADVIIELSKMEDMVENQIVVDTVSKKVN